MNRQIALRSARKWPLLSRVFSDQGLTKKAYLNALAAGLDYATRLGVGFFVKPLIVAGLGSELNGAWRVLGSMVGYVSAAGGRPTQTLKWTIASLQASDDHEEKRRNVGSAVMVALMFCPLLAAVGGTVAWFAPTLLGTSAETATGVRLAAMLLVMNLMFTSLAHIPQSVLQGQNLGYKRMGLSALLVILGAGFTLTALYFETGLIGLAAANCANTVLSAFLFLKIVRSYVPWFGFAKPVAGDIRKFFDLSCWFLIWRLVMRVMMTSDMVLLGMLSTLSFVTTYELTKYTAETLVSLAAILVSGITPGLGGIIGRGDLSKAIRLRGEVMILTWLLIACIGTTILCWNRVFVSLWVGSEHYAGSLATLMIVVMMLQFVLIRNDSNIIDLSLDLKQKVLVGGLSTAVSVGLAAALVGPMELGISGLCLGFVAGRLLLSIGYPWIVGKHLGLALRKQFTAAIRPLIATGVLFTGAMALENYWSAPGSIRGTLAVAMSAPLVVLLIVQLARDAKHQVPVKQTGVLAFVAGLLFALGLSRDALVDPHTWPGLVLSVAMTAPVVFALAAILGLSQQQRSVVWQRVVKVASAGPRKQETR